MVAFGVKNIENHIPNLFTHLVFQQNQTHALTNAVLYFAVLTIRDCALLLVVRDSQVSNTELFIAAFTLKFTANTIKEREQKKTRAQHITHQYFSSPEQNLWPPALLKHL